MKEDRTAVITGAAGGIGKATADLFIERGWHVIGLDSRPLEPPASFEIERVDLRDPEAVGNFFQEFAGDRNTLEALVNNAALQICKPLMDMQVEEWDAVLETNLRAVFLTSKHAYPFLRAAHGSIVNVSSVHAVATSADIAAYAASKGGVTALTRAMAIEFAGDGVRVNAVLPGAVDTGMLRNGLSRGHAGGGSVDKRVAHLAERTVIGRVAKPEEIARAILFLADSGESGFMTGGQLVIDGGATIRLSTE
jgi:glucose 1-dehydrogenase